MTGWRTQVRARADRWLDRFVMQFELLLLVAGPFIIAALAITAVFVWGGR